MASAYDNAMAESFFASVEGDLIDRRSRKSFASRMAVFALNDGRQNPRRRDKGLRPGITHQRWEGTAQQSHRRHTNRR